MLKWSAEGGRVEDLIANLFQAAPTGTQGKNISEGWWVCKKCMKGLLIVLFQNY